MEDFLKQSMEKTKTDISNLFNEAKQKDDFLKVCAPMVRYSKLQFRTLIKQYGVDLCFTPMILADSFCRSSKARNNEFSTSTTDTPVIAQFAAKTVHDFVGASELVYPYVDGVDLNCGCPQRWAIKDGYGCGLLSEPEIIHSLVRNFKNCLPNTFSISVKIRLLKDLKDTIELCRSLENCGVSFLTVHGRKTWQKSSDPVDIPSLKHIKASLQIPMIANGNVKNLVGAKALHEESQCDGVMAAQGMLTNPLMFTGAPMTTVDCVQDWLNICHSYRDSVTYQCFHHHLVFMLEKVLNRKQKQIFNNLSSIETVHNFLEELYGIKPENAQQSIVGDNIQCVYNSLDYSILKKTYASDTTTIEYSENLMKYDSNLSQGKYFTTSTIENDDDYGDFDNMTGSLFIEPY